MKNKNIKKKIFMKKSYQLGEFKEYLENMARNGWMFSKKKAFILYFEKCEPKEVHFAIDIFNDASPYDIRPDYYSEEYVDFCEQSGWKLIQNNGKIMIFCTEETDPTPIQTDPKIELDAAVKCTLKESIIPFFIFLGLLVAYMIMFATSSISMVDHLVIFNDYMLPFVYFMIVLMYGLDVLQFVIFYRRNKARVENGQSLIYESGRGIEIARNVLTIAMFAFVIGITLMSTRESTVGTKVFIGIFLAIGIMIPVIEWFRQGNSKLSSEMNELLICIPIILIVIIPLFSSAAMYSGIPERRISYTDENGNITEMTICHADIPISLEDLGVATKAEYIESYESSNSTVFGKSVEYSQTFYDEKIDIIGEGMECDVLESRFSSIIDSFVKDKLELKWTTWHKIMTNEVKLWNAEEVYAGDENDDVKYRIVKWKDKVLFFYGQDVKMDKERISLIMEKLNL